MKLKSKITVASVTSILTLSSAMAEVNQPIAVPVAQTTNIVDLSYAFGDSQDLQIQAMTQQEMDETEGAVAPLVAGILMGGATSAWMNHGMSYLKTGRLASTKSTAIATGAGMVGGAYTNVMLRGAGISTSVFNKSAWNRANALGNVVIRGNGAAVSNGTVGIWNNRK